MNKLLLSLVLLFMPVMAQAQNWNSSPYNYRNSEYNYQNSPYNYQNSPYNWQNSPYNLHSRNGIYDSEGNRQGYIVTNPSGVTNFFDNEGNRTGYIPAPK